VINGQEPHLDTAAPDGGGPVQGSAGVAPAYAEMVAPAPVPVPPPPPAHHMPPTTRAHSARSKAVATWAYAVCARRTERLDVHLVEVLDAAAEGGEQGVGAVEGGEGSERGNERGVPIS
jgi:hypothetical protein